MTEPAAWALHTDLDLDTCNLQLAALEDAGLLGLVEEGGSTTAYFASRVEGLPLQGTWRAVPNEDHLARWRASITPVRVGPFVVTPPWIAAPEDALALVIEPGQAFGTGHHETTLSCLAALAELDLTAARVVDVGTGTGVLAIAAARRGAAEVIAVDTDPLAITVARENIAANGARVRLVHGSADAVEGRADVVLANLDTATHTALAPALAALLTPGGVLVASGVARERRSEAWAVFTATGLAVDAVDGEEWTRFICRRP